jgi:hypothetical protein
MIGDDLRDRHGHALARRDVEEFVGAVRVGMRPSTPVTTNCVFGNFSPSIAMNGMLPPSPIRRAARRRPSATRARRISRARARAPARSSPHRAFGIERHFRAIGRRGFKNIFHDRARFFAVERRRQAQIQLGRRVGQHDGACILRRGHPSMPVTDNCGRQVRLSTSSARSCVTGSTPGANGNLA